MKEEQHCCYITMHILIHIVGILQKLCFGIQYLLYNLNLALSNYHNVQFKGVSQKQGFMFDEKMKTIIFVACKYFNEKYES